MASITSNTIPVFFGVTATGDSTLDPFLSPQKWGTGIGTGAVIGYSFPSYFSAYEAGYGDGTASEWLTGSGATKLSAQQQSAFELALEEFENVANLSFYEVTETPTEVGEIRIAMTDDLRGPTFRTIANTIFGYAYYPFNDGTGGDIWLNPDVYQFATVTPGEDDGLFTTLMHELGHALGLGHPFDAELSGVSNLDPSLDNIFYTVMTYTLDPTGMGYFPDREPTTLMVLDIQAIQHLYGANNSHETGDNTYSYSEFGRYFETIWDAGGEDEINYVGASTPGLIDLREGQYSELGVPIFFDDGSEGGGYYDYRTVWIAYGTEIENAFGGLSDDVIYGNDLDNAIDGDTGNDDIESFDGADTLTGWTGDDTLDGGDGLDYAVYYGARSEYVLTDLGGGSWQVDHVTPSGTDEGTDIVHNVEYLEFTDQTLTIVNFAPTGTVTISGTAQEDATLTAISTLADLNGLGPITYTWSVGGVVEQSSSLTTFPVFQVDVGKTITVTASYTDMDGYFESVVSSPTAPVINLNDVPTGMPEIVGAVGGNVSEDQTISASPGTLADDDGLGTIVYTWYVGGTAVGSSPIFNLGQGEVGQGITLLASYTDQQGTAEAVFSATTNPVINVNDDPTGSVWITGTPEQGQTLMADDDLADEDGLGAITYFWIIDGLTVSTGPTFALSQTHVGKQVSVRASYTDQQGTFESDTSSPTATVSNINDAPTGIVTITGAAQQGTLLTAANNLVDPDGNGTITYTWKADGADVGSGMNYTPGQSDVGKMITVVASYTDGFGTAESVESDPTTAVANTNDAPTGAVTISGTVEQDSELTANNTLDDLDGNGTITYTWMADGEEVGSGGMTFTPGQSEVGKMITVVASYTDGFGNEESVESDPTAAVANVNDAPTGTVTISGTAEQDSELTAANTLSDLDGDGPVTYTWMADGEEVGSGGMTFTPGQSEVGKMITVVASYTDGFGTEESVESDPTATVANVNDAPTGAVTISGTAEQDSELTAANTLDDLDGNGPITYTWMADGEEVGSGGMTFTPGQSEVGKMITVVASYTDGFGNEESVESDPTATVANVNDAPTGSVTISGTPEQDSELTAANTLDDLDGNGPITYTWMADGEEVGSGGMTFTPGQSEVGKMITVVASYTDGFGNEESVESDPTTAVANVNDAPTGDVTITGAAVQDQELTANNTLDDLDGNGPITYTWMADGGEVGTGMTYTPDQDDVGKSITVIASYTDQQGTAESVESDPTNPVLNQNELPEGSVTITGLAEQGQELTAGNDLSDMDGLGPISYSWAADGEEVATGMSFTPGQDEVGKAIVVTASYTDMQGAEESVDSDPTELVSNVNDAPTGNVTFSGLLEQGQELTASNTLEDLDGLGEITYTWLADGEIIVADDVIPELTEGAVTGTSFTLRQSEVGKTISVMASYTDAYGMDESVISEASATPVANINDAPTGAVSISGEASEGVELTVVDTLDDADGLGERTYEWRAGEDVVGTGMTFTPGQSEVGKTITVTANFTDLQGTAESVQSDPTAVVANTNNSPTGSVTISGTPAQGQTLTAANTLVDIDGIGDITYRWNSGGADRGTGSTLLLTQADVGNTVTVSASYTDVFGFLETVISAATAAVANVNDPVTGAVLIAGTALVGETLTASNTLSDPDGPGEITYTWKADDTTVGMGDSYLLTESEVGKTITATAMFTDGGGTEEAVTSEATSEVEPLEADPLFNEEFFIDVEDFIVSSTLVREVIGLLPGTGGAGAQSFNLQNGATTEEGQMKPGRFGDFLLDPETGEYRYVPDKDAVDAADGDDSEVFVISVSDGSTVQHRVINVANFNATEFIVMDSTDDGLLYDAQLMLDTGEAVSAADAQLYRTYAGALGRIPDVGGFDWWSDQISQGLHDLFSMVTGFLFSPEFLSFFPGATHPNQISSADFVNHMYVFVFGREADTGGFLFWTGELDSGNRTQTQVVVEMTQSNEFVGITALAAVDFLVG